MGLYTNPSFYNGYTSSDYTSVEPFKGEHFNYHELGIIAATESAANRDAFMRAIALNELASVEQYGTDQVFYESVNISGIFESIKKFFKKIIEKIHKIFHTFIAKLGSWFQSSKEFAKKYEKEIIKKWGNVKSDWEFKGYIFKNIPGKSSDYSSAKDTMKNSLKENNGTSNATGDLIKALIDAKNGSSLTSALTAIASVAMKQGTSHTPEGGSAANADYTETNKDSDEYKSASMEISENKKELAKFRDNLDNWKDKIRGAVLANTGASITPLKSVASPSGASLDSKEFTEELFKKFRNGEDSKVDVKLSELGSATDVIHFLKEYDKIKTETEGLEKAMVKSIDELIDAISKAQDDLIKTNKDKKDNEKLNNELIISATGLYQTCWGFVKETQSQAFAAQLQAVKDCCAQCKEVCVKVIGSSKKMTEESVDYSNYGGSNNFNSFIENVKLV